MSHDEIERKIEDHLKRTSRLLPDGFETEDLLDELRIHINESYSEKVQKRPTEEPVVLIQEVLDDLGTPEEIAKQYSVEQLQESDSEESEDKWIRYTMRLVATVLVVVITSWIAATLTEGVVNFNVAVVMLLFLSLLEWYIRAQQTKDA